MKRMDLFTRVVLAVIAVCLVILTAQSLARPGVVAAEQNRVVQAGFVQNNSLFYRVWEDGRLEYMYFTNQRDAVEKEIDRTRSKMMRDFEPRWYRI